MGGWPIEGVVIYHAMRPTAAEQRGGQKRTDFCCCQELRLTRALHLAGFIRGYSPIDHRRGSATGR